MNSRGESSIAALVVVAGVIIAAVSVFWMFVGPIYRVWEQEQVGKAMLARADQERRVLVTQAQAEKDAARLRADAIEIMGQAAKDFPEYRQQEFMAAFGEALREGHVSQIVYVPTEANLPILEARTR